MMVAPSERHVAATALKADVRNYVYAGEVKLVAARLYVSGTDHELSHARRRLRAGIHGNTMKEIHHD